MSLKETKKVDTNRYQLEITVDGEKFREAIKEAYKKNGKKINVPGFRKGKAPLHISRHITAPRFSLRMLSICFTMTLLTRLLPSRVLR